MNSIKDITLNTHLQGLKGLNPGAAAKQPGENFANMIKQSLEAVNTKQVDASKAAASLASGENGNIHEVMIKMDEAEISMRLMVQIRNKVVDAYQEIMRMQV